jgi:hypothetical protein
MKPITYVPVTNSPVGLVIKRITRPVSLMRIPVPMFARYLATAQSATLALKMITVLPSRASRILLFPQVLGVVLVTPKPELVVRETLSVLAQARLELPSVL